MCFAASVTLIEKCLKQLHDVWNIFYQTARFVTLYDTVPPNQRARENDFFSLSEKISGTSELNI